MDEQQMYNEAIAQREADQERFWESLSKEDQLKAFCAVSRRIYQGELVDHGSYRHVLYSIFGFGKEAYSAGMDAGYMAIHNALFPLEDN